jgi:cell wall-associated NlpC family hydrolase
MHKTLLYALENSGIILEENSKTASIKKIKSSSSNKQSDVKTINQMLEYANTKIGIRYHYGGTSDRGYDCSGFTMKMFEKLNLQIPRTAQEQAQIGQKIDLQKARPGDLVFFEKHHNTINHVGIVIENSKGVIQMIHASTSRGIRIDVLEEGSYWHPRVRTVRRIMN